MAELRVESLHVYPVKSCRGISLDEVSVRTEGFRYDREWMIVDGNGRFITQRERPQLARIATGFGETSLVLSALGHGQIDVPLRYQNGPTTPTQCWRFSSQALDCGADAAAWLSEFLGGPARLVRFSRNSHRDCNPQWTAGIAAFTQFSDGYPMLVLSTESVSDLRSRMGLDDDALPLNRFRANLVVSGVGAYEEDFIDTLSDSDLAIKLVKPCARCSVPHVDQSSGSVDGPSPLDTLVGYRMNPAVEGATLGMNAIVARGAGARLRLGQTLSYELRFD